MMGTRDEIIEQRARHIIPLIENAERIGRHEFVKLSPVDAAVLVLLLKEKVAELTMKRYATDKEEADLYATRQSSGMFMNAHQARNLIAEQAAQQMAHIKAHQAILTQGIAATQVAPIKVVPKKRKLFNW